MATGGNSGECDTNSTPGDSASHAAATLNSAAQSYMVNPYGISYGAAVHQGGGYGGGVYGGGYNPAFGGYGEAVPIDPSAMQASLINQHMMNGGAYSQAFGGMGGAMYPGGIPMAASFYGGGMPTYPGPSYYDPYGMLNPAACVVPVPASSGAKANKKKKDRKWCCC